MYTIKCFDIFSLGPVCTHYALCFLVISLDKYKFMFYFVPTLFLNIFSHMMYLTPNSSVIYVN